MSEKLTKLRMVAWGTLGNSLMLLAVPFYCVDVAADWSARAISRMCKMACIPLVIGHDYCVKRDNALRRALSDRSQS